MTTTTTPATDLADRLTALAEHLRTHPEVPNVKIDGRSLDPETITLQISTYPWKGEPQNTAALLLWAKSFGDNGSVWLGIHGEPRNRATYVEVVGKIGGRRVRVWDVDFGELYRLTKDGVMLPMSVTQLTEYVEAGTVEGIGAA
ncbi:hypothetical protein [Amycolatopsis sp. cmx-4-83]|uniref:hypothetical protein n=1 Tax=Amycolatopsis sp. cmx-4-83 TaxID=2790940 RepID=UPI0039787E06